jgi:hypothetical protein
MGGECRTKGDRVFDSVAEWEQVLGKLLDVSDDG